MLRTLLTILAVLCFTAGFASAQVVNVTVNGVAQTPVASGHSIFVTVAPTGVTSIRLVGSTPETDIGRLDLDGETSGRVDVLIGTVANNPALDFPVTLGSVLADAGRHWGGLLCSNANLQERTRVAFAISGDVKSLEEGDGAAVRVGQVYRGQVGGSMKIGIHASPHPDIPFPDGEAIARLIINGTVGLVNITAQPGDVDRLVVGLPGATGATMMGGIRGDSVNDIVVHGRMTGSVVSWSGPIRSITADGISGFVQAGEEEFTTQFAGYLGRIICNGDLEGAVFARAIDAKGASCEGIQVSGNLNADIYVFDYEGKGYIAEPITAGGTTLVSSPPPRIFTHEILPRAFDHPCGGGTTLTFFGGNTVVQVTTQVGTYNGTNQDPPVVIRSVAGNLSVRGNGEDSAQVAGNVAIEAVGGNLGVVSVEEFLPGAIIRATQGSIGEVRGKVGTLTGGPVTIAARDGITLIDASLLNASITVGDGTSPSGLLGTLKATTLLGSVNTGTIGTL